MKFFDRYNLNARLRPALLAILPGLIAIALVFPALYEVGNALLGLLVSCGLLFFLAQHARERGKKLEEAALESRWDEYPSVRFFRHRDQTIDPVTKARYHAVIRYRMRGAEPPSPEEELNDPEAADAIYRGATEWLKAQSRDQRRFPLVIEENINYGFRRNLLGLKPHGLIVSAFSLVGASFVAYCPTMLSVEAPATSLVWSAIAFSVLSALAWVSIVTRGWVDTAAENYAKRLLEVCDLIDVGGKNRTNGDT